MNRTRASTILLTLLALTPMMVGTALVAPASAASPPGQITSVGFEHTAFDSANDTYVWASEPNTLDVRFEVNETGPYQVCTTHELADGATTTECKTVYLSETGDHSVHVQHANFTGMVGKQNLTVALKKGFAADGAVVDQESTSIRVIAKTGDLDDDRLTNAEERQYNTSIVHADTDGDGIPDGAEVLDYGTSPILPDTDGDKLTDAQEINGKTSATVADTDGDGIPDGVEMELGTPPTDPTADTDGDGLTDAQEFVYGTDPTVRDTDGDLLSDATEKRLGTDPSDASTTFLSAFIVLAFFGTLLGAYLHASTVEESYFTARLGVLGLPLPGGAGRRQGKNVGDVTSDGGARTAPVAEASASVAAADASTGGGTGSDESTDSAPVEVLTDEERVREILAENGGWVYQSDINDRTEWSKSKVSRLLSRMAEEGEVEKICVGRQNIIAEEGSLPDGATSPFDD